MDFHRITIISGHYGSGKTNVAIALARELRAQGKRTVIADLDIVNPYFRTKDSEAELNAEGIDLIASPYAGSNVDFPALPQEIYRLTDDTGLSAVIDVGGDERGALALGRLAPAVLKENDYDMLMVINCFRPLTRDVESTLEVMAEIENACGIRFTGIINNSNLGEETTPEIIRSSQSYAEAFSKATGLPIVRTAVEERLQDAIKGDAEVLKLKLQKKPYEV